ncbi:hypothetical protein Tco_0105337, partial [Tanacetum coccineum]
MIWEDFQYQIDNRLSKLRRREIMPYPRFTKLIIKNFLSQHKSLAKLKHLYINTIKDDGVLNRLKFVRTGEDFQEYGRAIPDTMLTEEFKQSEAYQTFLALSTGLIPPKKTRGKGSKGKKASVTPKKKSLISVDDNIIPEPDVALELGKSIRKTEAEIAESDESDGEPANRPTGRRRPSGITFRDTSRVSKKKSLDQSQKLKGIQVMTEEEQLVADTKKAIKSSKEALILQQRIEDSSEGAGITPEVPDELTGKTSSEGAGIIPEVPDEVKGSSAAKADAEIDWGSKDDSYQSDEEDVNVDDITWLSTDEEEKAKGDGDEEDDDRSIDIEETDDERT